MRWTNEEEMNAMNELKKDECNEWIEERWMRWTNEGEMNAMDELRRDECDGRIEEKWMRWTNEGEMNAMDEWTRDECDEWIDERWMWWTHSAEINLMSNLTRNERDQPVENSWRRWSRSAGMNAMNELRRDEEDQPFEERWRRSTFQSCSEEMKTIKQFRDHTATCNHDSGNLKFDCRGDQSSKWADWVHWQSLTLFTNDPIRDQIWMWLINATMDCFNRYSCYQRIFISTPIIQTRTIFAVSSPR
jgi:hypothetical protein